MRLSSMIHSRESRRNCIEFSKSASVASIQIVRSISESPGDMPKSPTGEPHLPIIVQDRSETPRARRRARRGSAPEAANTSSRSSLRRRRAM
jgi:hypothetical protein